MDVIERKNANKQYGMRVSGSFVLKEKSINK